MKELAVFSNETVNLGYLDGIEIMYIDKIITQEVLRMEFARGSRLPAQCSAMGKAALAFRPNEELEKLIPSISFVAQTPHSIISPESLREELEQIRKNGFAIDDEEYALGVRCVAAPIFNHSGPTRYAISVAGPTARMTHKKIEELKRKVPETCKDLSRRMGFED